ncbi:MAG: GatB/YqeY domain-containing protein [Alphaproteobacteria bacterium]|nr:GatB/YqeY domain-containing protein [Alphaproteobacteria bacterium]MDE2162019.1 GatB/YqeY domain-containing protein [Alphaproteobacteria bacterium]MDE2265407.1 GatB/YqeY domain-containing protein [Alphaproteobacteria bacterium]MDE2499062.1 GatB/YqeY domain-containing protein [Alphaproteobacteria bacterium]
MALRDLLNDALNSTPTDNERRLSTLRAVISTVDAQPGATDSDIHAIISKIIMEREQQAASYSAAGQTEMAKAERFEIDALRGFLRAAEPAKVQAAKKPKVAPKAETSRRDQSAPLFTRNQIIIASVAVVLVVAAAVLYLFVFTGGSNDLTIANGGTLQVQLYEHDRTLGNPKAPITVLEYAAPACPHCSHFDQTIFPLVKKNYIDTGKVFYIFRVFPINPADPAAEAIARCLPADKYFQFIDLLFRNQPKWDPEYGVTDVRGGLIQLARVYGMSAEKVDQCIADKSEQDRINQVAQDGETKYNIQGVPTFIINGTEVQAEDATWPSLKARFDSLLSKH